MTLAVTLRNNRGGSPWVEGVWDVGWIDLEFPKGLTPSDIALFIYINDISNDGCFPDPPVKALFDGLLASLMIIIFHYLGS
ncbi:MAG: hypothetical protein ACRCTJ_01465 [Brevinema sp.]